MIPFFSFVNWVSALLVGAFGIILYLGSKSRPARAYAWVAFSVQMWAIGVGSYFYATDPWWIVFWNQYNHFAAGLIAVMFYLFSIIYPENSTPSKKTVGALVILEAVLFYLYFFTHTIITDAGYATLPNVNRYDLFFEVGPVFHTILGVFFVAAFLKLLKKRKLYPDYEKEVSLIITGTFFGFVPVIIAEVLLPFAGYYDLYHTGPAIALLWVAFLIYSIAKHRILNIRLAFAEVSVLAMSVILFVNIFLSEEATFGVYGRITIFLAFAVVGAFFIRNIVRKEEQKEELAKVTAELQKLNGSLELQVTARTQELSEKKRHSETILENLTNGLVEYTPSFEVIRINKAAAELLGVQREGLVGRTISPSDSKNPELESLALITFPILSQNDKKPASTATGIDYEVNELSVSSPKPRELQVVTTSLPSETAKKNGFMKVIRDVTGEKRTSREKSEFIGIAAHQLRTPLSGTKWSLNTILEGSQGELTTPQRTALLRAHETNEKMISLVNDLLSAARIEDGRFGYEFHSTQVADVLTTSLADSKDNAEHKKVRLSLSVDSKVPEIWADPDKLSLAFHNLIENAVHYTSENGTVSVTLKGEPKEVVVTVTDTGIGIRASDIPSLFTKFFRAENAKKLRTDGTGLGLFIVKNIIARHGGTITVQSKEHEGAAFTVRLPKDRSRVPEADETIYY